MSNNFSDLSREPQAVLPRSPLHHHRPSFREHLCLGLCRWSALRFIVFPISPTLELRSRTITRYESANAILAWLKFFLSCGPPSAPSGSDENAAYRKEKGDSWEEYTDVPGSYPVGYGFLPPICGTLSPPSERPRVASLPLACLILRM